MFRSAFTTLLFQENHLPASVMNADSVDATAEDIKPNEPGPAPSIAAIGIAPAGAAATDNNFITEAGKWPSRLQNQR
jgi:hypothetical protein